MGITGTRATVSDQAAGLVAAHPRVHRPAGRGGPGRAGRGAGRGGGRVRRRRDRRLGLRAAAADGVQPRLGRDRGPRAGRRTGRRSTRSACCGELTQTNSPVAFLRARPGATGTWGRCRCGPTRCASCSASSARCGSPTPALRPRPARRATCLDIAVWAVPFGLIVGGRAVPVIDVPGTCSRRHPNVWSAARAWEGGLGVPGRSRSARSVPGSPAAGRGSGCRRSPTRWRPGRSSLGRPSAYLGNWFNHELPTAAPPSLPWAVEIAPAATGSAGVSENFATFAPDVPATSCCGDVAAAVLVIWADRRFAAGRRAGSSRSTSPPTASAGCGGGIAAHRPGSAAGRAPVDAVHRDRRRPGRPGLLVPEQAPARPGTSSPRRCPAQRHRRTPARIFEVNGTVNARAAGPC